MSKGLTIPLDKYGGDKFEMLRLDCGFELNFSLGDDVDIDDLMKKSWEAIDEELNKQAADTFESLKQRK